MIPVIGRPVELVAMIPVVHGILCLIPSDVDEGERLAHDSVPVSTTQIRNR